MSYSVVLTFACCSVIAAEVAAQAYPTKTIRIIVAAAPQGGTDTIARIIAENLSQSMRQQVIVDNRPGASGAIGATIAAKSSPDGYTLMMNATTSAVIMPLSPSRPPYSARNFAPVSLVALTEFMLVTHPSLGVRTVSDLIALAKSRPGQVAFSSSGNYGLSHLAGELLMQRSSAKFVHVPYKGGAPASLAIVTGEVGFMIGTLPSVMPHVTSGRLRAIAITSEQRSKHAPEIPAIAETLPKYEVTGWYGVQAPAGTPREIIARLNTEIVKAVATERVERAVKNAGLDPKTNTPEEFAAQIAREGELWGNVFRNLGMPPSN
jgi:tripartite-type tricarboxylate transporter receptor subunit TctC